MDNSYSSGNKSEDSKDKEMKIRREKVNKEIENLQFKFEGIQNEKDVTNIFKTVEYFICSGTPELRRLFERT